MRKFGWTALLGLALVLTLGGGGALAATGIAVLVEEEADTDVAMEAPYTLSAVSGGAVTDTACEADIAVTGSQGPNYGIYARFGLSYDARENALYYQQKRVRIFQDTYPLGENACSLQEHFDPVGIIDVEAQRDLSAAVYNADGSQDPGGILTGLRVHSDADFAARDLMPWTAAPERQATCASEGRPMTAAEKQSFYAPYAVLGIVYDAATDCLSYQGQAIHRFLDVQQSNGESFSSGRFRGTMTQMTQEGGAIDVTILRDYTQPDAAGNGKITGVHAESAK